MNIPDCYDPVSQEDRRQAEWDRAVRNYPVCTCCGHTIFHGVRRYRLEIGKYSIIVCDGCKAEMDETEDIE